MASVPARSEAELNDDDRERLHSAHRRLQDAVEGYEQYLGRELKPGKPVLAHDAADVAAAQARIEDAERELWRVREEVLGWERPSWAPAAAVVTDWFSDEDSVYDTVDDGRLTQ